MLSVIPDVDIFIPFLQHRGPTHSIIMASIIFVPIFILYRIKTVPYFIALIQHSMVGDYIAGGHNQILWPATTQYFGTNTEITSPTSMTIEWVVFLASIIAMVKTKDLKKLLEWHDSNIILTIPTFTVLLPTFLAFPLYVPSILVLPHVVYLILFLTSILIYARKISAKHVGKLVTNRSIGT